MATREQQETYKATLATTDEQECFKVYSATGARRGATAFIRTTGAGSLKFYYGFHDGVYSLLQTDAIAASATDCTAVDFDLITPDIKVTWTSTADSSAVVVVDMYTY
tara:strand:+ start:68 stop:388 length:321 start_codon:yes stop_codon:yes gene_type:complete